MKVLVLEPHAHGHHGPYLSWMARGLAERGFEINVVTLPETAELPATREKPGCARGNERISVRFTGVPWSVRLPSGGADNVAGLVARELAYWRLLRAWYKAHAETVQPDVVFLPYLDYCLYAIGLLGSPFSGCPWVGLAMRPSFHYQEMGVIAPKPSLARLKKALFFRMLSNTQLRCLLTIDEPLVKYLTAYPALAAKTTFLPEPAELVGLPAPFDAKQRLGLPTERRLILVYGAITARKGVPELLRALADPAFPTSADVLLAGKIAPEIHQALVSPAAAPLLAQGRVRLLDRFIEIEEEPLLFAAANIVWLGYRGHYNASGVLVQAASAGCPVVACEEGILGWQTQRHGLGRTVNPENAADVAAAVATLLDTVSSKAGRNEPVDLWRPPSFSEAQDILAYVLGGR